jgi:hypothetical protein
MTGEANFSVKTAYKSEHKNQNAFSLTSLLVLLALIFMEHTQKSDEAKLHRILEKHVEKECHYYLPI